MAGNHVFFTLVWLFLGFAGVCSKLLLVKTPVNPEVNQTVSLNCSGVFGTTMVKRLCDGQPLPDYNKEEDGYGRVYYFPPSEDRVGIFSCENFLGDRVSIDTSIFPPNAGIFSPSFSVTAHDGDDVTLAMDIPEESLLHTANVSWRLYQHGLNCRGIRLLPDQTQSEITRQNVTKQKDGGMYEMSLPDDQQGDQRSLVQLLVTDCPAMLWGPGCSEPCPSCENGGVCGEDGLCVCPPGFSGDVCQIGCGRNRYGYDCENNCGGNCTDMLFCLLPPYGCSCGTGLQGRNCDQECASGTYGAGCSQSCGRCEDGASCDPYTGACPDERCAAGWEGTTCKQQIITKGKNNAFLIAVGVSACTLVLVGSLLWFYLRTTSKCAPKICGPDFDLSTVRGISDLAQTRSLYTVESFITDDLHLKARSKFGDLEIERAILKIDTNAIGSGAFGKVYKATVTEGTASSRLPKNVVAVKCLKDNATSQQKADFLEEIEHMVEVGSHPNILQLHGCCTAEQPIYMVVEYMQHGDLLGFLRRCKQSQFSKNAVSNKFDEKNMYQVARQVARGMEYLCGLKFIHGDLAARNVLVGDGLCVKISDFGLSSDIYRRGYYREDPWRKVPVKWAAPERLMEGMKCSIKADVWSFGILLYEVATLGEDPYPDIPNSTAALVSRLSSGYRMEQPEGCPNRMYDLMCRCWEWEPGSRPSFTRLFNDCDQALQDKSDYRDVAGMKVSINSDDIDDVSDSAEDKDQEPDVDDLQTSQKDCPGSRRKWSYFSLAWEADDLFTVSGSDA